MKFRKKLRKARNNSKVVMERIDDKEIPDNKEEVRLFVTGIDSSYLIPHFLKHHFDIGVDRIFYIDNNSSDNSLEILRGYDKVHVWLQEEEFLCAESRARRWRESLLCKYGIGHWCLAMDVDELFIFPDYENKSIREFTKEQNAEGCDVVRARCIDMYSDKKVKDTMMEGSLVETCPYFDKNKYGCRKRVLGLEPYFIKMPLFRYSENILETTGSHHIAGYSKMSNIVCGFLHFKFISDFLSWNDKHCRKFQIKGARFDGLWEEIYVGLGDINFYDEKISMRYCGSKVLDIFKNIKGAL